MKKLFVVLMGSVLLMTAAENKQTFTGVVTDTMCGGDHKAMKMSPEDKCVRECIRMDPKAKYALWDGKNLYALADQKTPEKHAGHKVKITGVLYEKTGILKADTIEHLR